MRKRVLLFGWVTLLLFPIVGFLLRYFTNTNWRHFFELEKISVIPLGYGFELGIAYGFLALLLMQAPIFETLPNRLDKMVAAMELKWCHGLFLSICAGVGEELLFRSGIQPFLGWALTSIGFVALHGYLNPRNWRFSLYGLIILPFIFLISRGFIVFGIWFCIAAHVAYDAVLFYALIDENKSERN